MAKGEITGVEWKEVFPALVLVCSYAPWWGGRTGKSQKCLCPSLPLISVNGKPSLKFHAVIFSPLIYTYHISLVVPCNW